VLLLSLNKTSGTFGMVIARQSPGTLTLYGCYSEHIRCTHGSQDGAAAVLSKRLFGLRLMERPLDNVHSFSFPDSADTTQINPWDPNASTRVS